MIIIPQRSLLTEHKELKTGVASATPIKESFDWATYITGKGRICVLRKELKDKGLSFKSFCNNKTPKNTGYTAPTSNIFIFFSEGRKRGIQLTTGKSPQTFVGGFKVISCSLWPRLQIRVWKLIMLKIKVTQKHIFMLNPQLKPAMYIYSKVLNLSAGCKKVKVDHQLHCLDAAKITRCSLSTRFSEIDWQRSVNKGVKLLAPSSWDR